MKTICRLRIFRNARPDECYWVPERPWERIKFSTDKNDSALCILSRLHNSKWSSSVGVSGSQGNACVEVSLYAPGTLDKVARKFLERVGDVCRAPTQRMQRLKDDSFETFCAPFNFVGEKLYLEGTFMRFGAWEEGESLPRSQVLSSFCRAFCSLLRREEKVIKYDTGAEDLDLSIGITFEASGEAANVAEITYLEKVAGVYEPPMMTWDWSTSSSTTGYFTGGV